MDLQGLSFNRQAGDIKLTPEETLKLQAGDVVRGSVQTINSDGTVQLVVRGKSVLAETQVPLQAGQELYLQVDRMENGKLYLRVVDPQVQAELPDLALRGVLTKIGLKADELTSTIARKLITYNMPVTRENIEAVIKMTNLVANSDGRTLEAAAYALSRGNRITNPEQLVNLVEFFSSPRAQEKTGQAIFQLIAAKSSVQSEITADTGSSSAQILPGPSEQPAVQPKPSAILSNDILKSATNIYNPETQAAANYTNEPKVTAKSDILKPSTVWLDISSADLPEGQGTAGAAGSGMLRGEQYSSEPVKPTTVTNNQTAAAVSQETPLISNNNVPETARVITETTSQKPMADPEIKTVASSIPSAGPFSSETAPELNSKAVNARPAAIENTTGPLEAKQTSVSGLVIANPESEGTAVNNNMTLNQKTADPVPPVIIRGTNNTDGIGSNISNINTADSNISKNPAQNQGQIRMVGSDQPDNEAVFNRPGSLIQTLNVENKSAATATVLSTLMDSDTVIDQVARRLSDLIRPALETIITDLDQTKPEANQIKQALKGQQALLPEIKFTRQILDQIGNGVNHPLRAAIESLDQEWTGQQLYNRLEGNTARDQSNIYFTLPLRWQGQVENAEVSINWRRDNRIRTSLPDNLTVNVGLNTVNMGTVVFHLRTQNRQIGLSVYLDNDAAKNQIDEAMPELLGQLNHLGYQTSFMGSQVVNQPKLHPEFVDNSQESLPPVTGLDLKI